MVLVEVDHAVVGRLQQMVLVEVNSAVVERVPQMVLVEVDPAVVGRVPQMVLVEVGESLGEVFGTNKLSYVGSRRSKWDARMNSWRSWSRFRGYQCTFV